MPERIRTVPDLRMAIQNAKTNQDRKIIYDRAAYLGLLNKLPREWNPDGTLNNDA